MQKKMRFCLILFNHFDGMGRVMSDITAFMKCVKRDLGCHDNKNCRTTQIISSQKDSITTSSLLPKSGSRTRSR